MNEQDKEDRKKLLKVFKQIIEWERTNKRVKDYSDVEMMKRIKKLIESTYTKQN